MNKKYYISFNTYATKQNNTFFVVLTHLLRMITNHYFIIRRDYYKHNKANVFATVVLNYQTITILICYACVNIVGIVNNKIGLYTQSLYGIECIGK